MAAGGVGDGDEVEAWGESCCTFYLQATALR